MAHLITSDAAEETPRAIKRKYDLERAVNSVPTTAGYMPHPEQGKVWIYTVGRRYLKTDHALISNIEIPACDVDQRYRLVRFLPQPFQQNIGDVYSTGDDPIRDIDARRVAQDICNPANPSLLQTIDDNRDRNFTEQDGTNYAKEGVFWSLTNPPSEQEIATAEANRDNTYRARIRKADQLAASDPAAVGKLGPEYRLALDYFGEERPWHKKFTPQHACPNCATQIPQGVAFHFLGNGLCCVIDWKRAVEAGVKQRDDVPREKRWWPQPGRKPGQVATEEDLPEDSA